MTFKYKIGRCWNEKT